jgi:hypothetical protein
MVDSSELESALKDAADNSGVRPRFYKLLLESDVFTLGVVSHSGRLSLLTYFRGRRQTAPFFTSYDIVTPPPVELPGSPTLQIMRVRFTKFAEMTDGLALEMNPNATVGREFSADEVRCLLRDGTIHDGYRDLDIPCEGLSVQLRRLNVPLPELEHALTTLLSGRMEVLKAYLVETERVRANEIRCSLMFVAHAPASDELSLGVSTVFSDSYDYALPVDLCFDEGDKEVVSQLERIGAIPFYISKNETDATKPFSHRD